MTQHQIQRPVSDDEPLHKIKLKIPDTKALEALLNGEKKEDKEEERQIDAKPRKKIFRLCPTCLRQDCPSSEWVYED